MRYARGFTLIELIIVTIIIGILVAAVAPLAVSSLRAYDNTLGNLIVLDKLRYATERLAREIREVNDKDVSTSTDFDIVMSASAPVFTRTFYTCNDASCSAASAVSDVRTVTVGRTASAVTLKYSAPATDAQILTDQVNSLVFSYYNQSGVTATSTADVRYVEIALSLAQNGQLYNQRTRVELRNR